MISTEQLVAALEELPARDRELLELSFCRGVPDEALAARFEVDEPAVLRRRAATIERLSGVLDLEGAEDLDDVLKALLEPSTWAEIGAGPTEGVPAADKPAPAEGVPAADKPAPAPQPAAKPKLLATRPQRADLADPPGFSRRRRRGPVAIAAGVLVVLGAAAGALTELAGSGGEDSERHFVPAAAGTGQLERAASEKMPPGNVTATVRGRPVLFSRPGGGGRRRVLGVRTEFESPRVFGVLRREGDWLAVQAPELENGQVGWLRADDAQLASTAWSLHADLSRRSIEVRRNGRAVRRLKVAVGAPGNPTPKGRFSVTDKLKVTNLASPYGCCVLALSGHQVDLPPDWPGGDRLAVHATRDPSSIGKAASLGCMRALPEQARWLIDTIPLGSPIFIEA